MQARDRVPRLARHGRAGQRAGCQHGVRVSLCGVAAVGSGCGMRALCVQGPKCTGHTRSPKKVQWDLCVSGRGLEERDTHRAPVTDMCV